MKTHFKILGIWVITVLMLCCKTGREKSNSSDVRFTGSMDKIMSGDLRGTLPLDSLSGFENLYALGVMENLQGEIQIWDGRPFISIVENDSIVIENELAKNAALLVYDNIKQWKNIDLPLSVSNVESLAGFLEYNGIEEDTFPFLLEGTVEKLEWHIINWNSQDSVHTHQKHRESGLRGSLENEEVKIIGFYTATYGGVFTHHKTPVHLHFVNENGDLAGHVDDLDFGEGMTLKIPGTKK